MQQKIKGKFSDSRIYLEALLSVAVEQKGRAVMLTFHEGAQVGLNTKIYLSEINFTEKPTGNKSPRFQTLVQYLHVHVVCIRIFYFGLHQLAI